ncbi:MAG: DsbC family protein [Neisseriaceae bacterium]
MKKFLLALLTICILSSCNKDDQMSTAEVKARIIKSVPGLSDNVEVSKSPINNIYEVALGRKIFYVSSDAKYMIFGNVIDTVTKENLTDKRAQEISKIDWKKLPLDLAIKVVNGSGKRKIAVFSDPECPYCHMFEKQTVSQLKDTTIYTFLFPLSIHPTALDDSKKIWCSQDRATTWTSWMREKKALPNNTKCDTSGLDTIYKIGTKVVQVDATPTIVLENGQILTGAIPAEQLMSLMDDADKKVSK